MTKDELELARLNRDRIARHDNEPYYRQQERRVRGWAGSGYAQPMPEGIALGSLPHVAKTGRCKISWPRPQGRDKAECVHPSWTYDNPEDAKKHPREE